MNKIGFIILVALVMSCGNSNEKQKVVEKQVNLVSQDSTDFIIAFYYNDSIKTGFEYYRKAEASLTAKQVSFQNQIQSKTQKYQNYVTKKQKDIQAGLLSENEMIKVQQKAGEMEQEIVQYQQREGAKLEGDMLKKLEEINKKLEAFGKMFSEKHGIDILMGYSSGQQINYIHPKMNVSGSFIDFLNSEQKKLEEGL
ncbi:MAG: OmpH family outer membrane protein [Crocinitomicaceae bacterium]|nr:OmpH family outer membrane protein [Crocinitomicaceae bacterium]